MDVIRSRVIGLLGWGTSGLGSLLVFELGYRLERSSPTRPLPVRVRLGFQSPFINTKLLRSTRILDTCSDFEIALFAVAAELELSYLLCFRRSWGTLTFGTLTRRTTVRVHAPGKDLLHVCQFAENFRYSTQKARPEMVINFSTLLLLLLLCGKFVFLWFFSDLL